MYIFIATRKYAVKYSYSKVFLLSNCECMERHSVNPTLHISLHPEIFNIDKYANYFLIKCPRQPRIVTATPNIYKKDNFHSYKALNGKKTNIFASPKDGLL